MTKRTNMPFSFVTLSLMLTLTFLAFPVITNATTYYVATNGSNTSPYDTWAKASTSIQTIVDLASNGDIIIVGSSDGHGTGTYTENVNVTKQLTIQSENGNSTTTIVAASSSDHVFEVTANNVTINGFSIYGATGGGRAGISLTSVTNCTNKNNRCGWDGTHTNYYGIYMNASSSCTINNNTASYNSSQGIYLTSTSNNNITSNVLNYNSSDGIFLTSSSSNTFSSNTANNNTWDGIHIESSSNNNTLSNNTATSNGSGGIVLSASLSNTLTSNTTNTNTDVGISLASSANNNTLSDNTANYNGNGILLNTVSGNSLTSDTVTHNQFGVYLTESSNNTISSNIMNNNDGRVDGDGIMLNNNCSNNTISNNTMNNDPGDGIEFYNSSNNTVTGNTLDNSGAAMRINYYSSKNTIVSNTVTNSTKGIVLEEESNYNFVSNNTITGHSSRGFEFWQNASYNTLTYNNISNNGTYGIWLPSGSYNTIYLNDLSNNTTSNIYSGSTTTTWHSPTTIYYDYNSGTFHKGYLGNYYSDGTHTGSYGIGGTYTIATDNDDDYQLMQTSGNYSLQTWYMYSNNKMYCDNMTKAGGSVTISGVGSHICIADQAAQTTINFSGSDTWTGQVIFTSVPTSGHTFTVEIGTSTDGSDFTAGGPQATLTGDGSSTVFAFATNASAFTVTTGKYLALKITNNNAGSYNVQIGGARDYISSPESSTNYALPVELSTFTASVSENQVILKWQTATEVNNYGFDVERKIPDQVGNDNLGWHKIGFIAGHGNSNAPINYIFVDKKAIGAKSFYYRLKQIDVDGKFEYSDYLLVKLNIPEKAELMQNSPNPFNPSTSIKFFIPNQSDVTIKVYDLLGREVVTLINKNVSEGFHIVFWDGKNKYRNQSTSGVYLYRLIAGSFSESKKMILVK